MTYEAERRLDLSGFQQSGKFSGRACSLTQRTRELCWKSRSPPRNPSSRRIAAVGKATAAGEPGNGKPFSIRCTSSMSGEPPQCFPAGGVDPSQDIVASGRGSARASCRERLPVGSCSSTATMVSETVRPRMRPFRRAIRRGGIRKPRCPSVGRPAVRASVPDSCARGSQECDRRVPEPSWPQLAKDSDSLRSPNRLSQAEIQHFDPALRRHLHIGTASGRGG